MERDENPPDDAKLGDASRLHVDNSNPTTHDVIVRVSEAIRIHQATPDRLKSSNARSTSWKNRKVCSW